MVKRSFCILEVSTEDKAFPELNQILTGLLRLTFESIKRDALRKWEYLPVVAPEHEV